MGKFNYYYRQCLHHHSNSSKAHKNAICIDIGLKLDSPTNDAMLLNVDMCQ